MPISENLLDQMKCSFHNNGHIAIEPILLKCENYGCKQCVVDSKDENIYCYNCKEIHKKKDLLNAPINKLAKTLIDSHLNDLFDYVDTNLTKASEAVNSNLYN